MNIDKRLYAVAVVGVLFSGTSGAADCDKLPIYTPESRNLREECERSKSIAEENRMRLKIACQQSKMAYEDAERAGVVLDEEDRASAERNLRKCAQDFPNLGWRNTPAPAPTPPTPTPYTRGLDALNQDSLDTAIAEFTAAIADDPNDVFPYIRRGTAYERKGDAVAAIADYRKALTFVSAETADEIKGKIRKLEKTKK